MFRNAILTFARRSVPLCTARTRVCACPQLRSSPMQTSRDSPVTSQVIRWYSASTALSEQEVQGRIIDLLKNFDKVTAAEKLSPTAHFYNDLGLDSLDTVEVVMAIEEEFSLEIPDKDADAIHSVDQAVKYILAQPDAH